MVKLYALFGIVTTVLWIFSLVDVVQSDEGRIRHLAKLWWLLIVLFFPFAGSIAWLVAGRPAGGGSRRASAYERAQPAFPEYDRPGRAAAVDPEKDEEFLRKVRERAEEQRRRHEAQRREREERGGEGGSSSSDH